MSVAPACSVMVRDTRLGQRVLSQAYETLKAGQRVLDLGGIPSNAFLLTNQISYMGSIFSKFCDFVKSKTGRL